MKRIRNSISNDVIVWGSDHQNTLGLVRSLGEAGIHPFVMIVMHDNDKSFILKSKYINKGYIFSSNQNCLEYILKEFSTKQPKPIIIATSDTATSLIDANYDDLIKHFYIPNGGRCGALEQLMSKKVISNLASQIGFIIPTTWTISDCSHHNEIDFPCIVKPIRSIIGSKSDITVLKNKAQMQQYFREKNASNFIIQKYIEKEYEFQLIGCSLDSGRTILMPGYTRIIRSSFGTNTGYLKYYLSNNFENQLGISIKKCTELIKACEYTGLFSMEFIRSKDNISYFLEVNFRNDANAYSVTAAGINLPYILVSYFAGTLDLKYYQFNHRNKVIFVMPEFVDIMQVVYRKISIFKWIFDAMKTDCFIYFHRYDPMPFVFYFYYYIFRKAIQKILV